MIRPDQSASYMSKNMQLWLPFFPRLMSQSGVWTSPGNSDGFLGCGWWVLSTAGLSACSQDVFEPQAERFYATKYVTSLSPAFLNTRKQISIVSPKNLAYILQCVLSNCTSVMLSDYWN